VEVKNGRQEGRWSVRKVSDNNKIKSEEEEKEAGKKNLARGGGRVDGK